MSPVTGGPALFIGTDEAYVALVRPELDPADPGVRSAAEQAGVTPEEFAGPGDVWAVLLERDGEGDGFELPGVRDTEPASFAEQLRAELAGAAAAAAGGAGPAPFTVDGGSVLRLEARPAGADAYAFSAYLTPPEAEGDPSAALTVETGPVAAGELLADVDAFLESLA
ncbi:hypothetical protein [Streptomyces antimicrobicus]|uniref:Uncharacterized protein n=1 Tax=Streptomyces antimicrobicus TaxID=2883108 RepID=A0ABS8B2Y0_9ACTN|nr:hypothetical protein [Streptomyces antimicrobicus]MCB5178941.1 hypothetical protein [Streptomyces antimicrobicus]